MSEHLEIAEGTKEEKYQVLYRQIEFLMEDEPDMIANMADVSAMIQDTFHFWWIGFYRVVDGILVLGPFQGPLACTRIKYGKGVCGTAWKENKTQLVPDVEQFPGHIACSSESKSEIVVPLHHADEIIGVLDIDSEYLNTFDVTDQIWLEKIARLFTK